MRASASVLHLDLDAFFAAVEQRDKPSLRGRPVVVGGVGSRGVVATASYEARRFGVRSAMSTREARARCPQAAFLTGRFSAYRRTSEAVMTLLRTLSPLVEPLSMDEAFVDLEASGLPTRDPADLTALADGLRARVREVTGGLTASVGVATSKLVAKIASDLDKPDGLVVVPPGGERALLRPLPVAVIPGVGPATAGRLRRLGIRTVADLERTDVDDLVGLLGRAHGQALHRLARAEDDRPVLPEREAKSVSVEDTYDTDLTDRALMAGLLDRHARSVARRLAKHGMSGRTVTIKVRLHDFTTMSRSATLPAPTDRAGTIATLARDLLTEVDTSGGVRLLGVGVSGLADWVQDGLFEDDDVEGTDPAGGQPPDEARREDGDPEQAPSPLPGASAEPAWRPGMDVLHARFGPGWVWGSGRGVVTVRFETAHTPPGPVRTFRVTDPELTSVPP